MFISLMSLLFFKTLIFLLSEEVSNSLIQFVYLPICLLHLCSENLSSFAALSRFILIIMLGLQ